MISRSLSSLLASAVVTAAVASSSVASAQTAPANDVQKKYVVREGVDGIMCKANGTLKELTNGKYKCYGAAGADKCAASIDAAAGKLGKEYLELFGDLLKKDKDGTHLYKVGCKDFGGADFAEFLAIGGIGYAKSTAQLDALLALGSPESLKGMGGEPRAQLVAALGRFGDAHKAKILPVLKNALAADAKILGFKQNALKLMNRFGSDDGVAYCMDVLKSGKDKDNAKVCTWYLGERKAAGAAALFARNFGDDKKGNARALSLAGGKDGIDVLKEAYEKNAGSAVVLPETAALANLGDKTHDYAADLLGMIEGRRPLSLKDRAKKAEELAAKKKNAEEKWQKREAETQEDIARSAAIEATYVTDAALGKKVDEALRATAKKKEWKKASAMATAALAQRGDKAAAAELVGLLGSNDKDAREIAVSALGASYDVPQAFLEYVGRKGFVPEASAPAALLKYIESESNEGLRIKALNALGAVRSGL